MVPGLCLTDRQNDFVGLSSRTSKDYSRSRSEADLISFYESDPL